MRWNHLILALLGVCILSKSVHSYVDAVYMGGYVPGDDDDGYGNKVVTQPNNQNGEVPTPEPTDYGFPDGIWDKIGVYKGVTVDNGGGQNTIPDLSAPDDSKIPGGPSDIFSGQTDGLDQPSVDEATTPDQSVPENPVDQETTPEYSGPDGSETTEEPVDNGGSQNTQTDGPDQPSVDAEATTPEDTFGQGEETTPDQSVPEDSETTPEPEDPAQQTDSPAINHPAPVDETTPEPEDPTTEPADLTDAPAAEVETTPEDTVEETTEDPLAVPNPAGGSGTGGVNQPTTEDSSVDETSEPPVDVETTQDPFAVPVPAGGSGTGGVNPPGQSTTDAADVESTTDSDPLFKQKMANAKAVPQGPWGNGKVYSTIAPSVLDTLPEDTALKFPPNMLPGQIPLDKLTDEYVVIDGQDDWSKVVANKHGFFVLHPVQTTGNNVIFDPYTIGQVLGYIYEFQEFNGQPPADGWTINLMNKPIPQPVRRKRSEGGVKSRRATLVFTKKADVVAKEEEHDYWKKVIASI
ncbi:hypothetical protein CAEBREN_02886 [Caenorhabditis brenneri]|uniref:Uncharacterized protein n=1 Tax=Caenorhabditis brenneri TaxID=135651 RepID=G0N2G9_CAEBE|nr:hypothetical protein CAEBREN_02886 [Caenorhabditis brenneri]